MDYYLDFFDFVSLLLLLAGLEWLAGVPDLAVLSGARADDSGVDGAGDAVGQLVVGLGDDEVLVDLDSADILFGRGIDHVFDSEFLDAFILGNHSVAVGAVDGSGVALVHLASSVVSAFARHL